MQRNFSLRVLGIVFVALLVCQNPAFASPTDDVKAAFTKFVKAQNDKNPDAVYALLDSRNFLWITRGRTIWGRDDATKAFKNIYDAGAWSLDVKGEPRIMMLADDVAQLYVPIDFTIGTPTNVRNFLMNQTLVKTPNGWVIASILPIDVTPAPPAPKPSPSP